MSTSSLEIKKFSGEMCPNCGAVNQSKIDNTRRVGEFGVISRRRICTNCGESFTTIELSRDQLMNLLKVFRKFNRIVPSIQTILGDDSFTS